MAGRGPAPKDPGARRRSNAPARGEWVDLPPLTEPVLPPLGPRFVESEDGPEEVPWRPATLATWEAWRVDPVSAMWSPSDIAFALDTIALHNGLAANTAGEVRLRMDSLGLTPKGKRDLRWRLVDEAPASEAPVPAGERQLRAV